MLLKHFCLEFFNTKRLVRVHIVVLKGPDQAALKLLEFDLGEHSAVTSTFYQLNDVNLIAES